MDLTKKTVHYTQEGKTVFDRFYLDEDYNVPEQKEAVQRIVYSSAKLKTEDVRPVENYVKVTGKAYYKILYMTQGVKIIHEFWLKLQNAKCSGIFLDLPLDSDRIELHSVCWISCAQNGYLLL